MRNPVSIVCLMLVAFGALATSPVFARGGAAPSIMGSPGYQRALEESRKRYREEAQPSTRSQSVHPRRKSRNRGQHH